MSANSKSSEVSNELSEILNEFTGIDESQFSSAKEIEAEAKDKNFSYCEWHHSCYYCRDNRGKWHLIRCIGK